MKKWFQELQLKAELQKIYREFPETMEELFNNTLEKRRLTAEKAKESFE